MSGSPQRRFADNKASPGSPPPGGAFLGVCLRTHAFEFHQTKYCLQTQLRDLAAQFARGLPSNFVALPSEGAGNAGRPMRPIAACAMAVSKKAHALVRSHRNHPAFPTQWFTAYNALSPVIRLFLSPSPVRSVLPTNLTPAMRHQNHTPSPSASGAVVTSTIRVHRIPLRVS